MKLLNKLEESDIDNVVNQNAKILLLTYYNYLNKLKSFEFNQLNSAKNNYNENVYLLAALTGQLETMEFLETIGLNIHIKNINGSDAYLFAAYGGHLEIMRILEEKDLNIHIKNNDGTDAYLLAAFNGHLKIMEFLEAKGFDIYIKNNDDSNAYLLAAFNGHLKIMEFLEAKGFDIYIKNRFGQNAYAITESQDIKTHLLTLGFKSNGEINIEYVYEQKINKFIIIYNNEDDVDYRRCYICHSDIILNDEYLKCGFKHATHNSCYKSYCESKNEINCECLFCLTSFIE
jgi:ankyrin repeat protein